MSTSQLVTVAGINKVWTATKALYNKLDNRLDDIGRVFKYKDTLSNWAALKAKAPLEVGDAYLVSADYPAFPEDPTNYPEYDSQNPSPRMFICIKAHTGNTPPSYSFDTDTDNSNHWSKYWNPIDLNLSLADTNKYGIVRLLSADIDHNNRRIQGVSGLYVNVPDATAKGNNSSTGLVKPGDGININNGEISIKAGAGILIDTTPQTGHEIKNTGIRGITVGSTKYSNIDGFTISSSNSNTIGFTDENSTASSITLKGACTNDISGGVGNSSKPIYITSGGEAAPITSLRLSVNNSEQSNYLATFTSGTAAGTNKRRTVEITGYGTSNNDDPTSSDSNIDVALHVNGAARVTGAFSALKVYHAVWNDISDAIEVQDTLKTDPGYCYFFDGKEYHRTGKYCQKGIIGIHSDTAGSVLGRKGKHKELDISVGGFVLAYVDKEYAPGTPLTSAPDGRLTKMGLVSRILHPERLVATYWKKETNKEWGDESHKIEVNGRHWVKVR
jgi:hypothetical protein